MSTSAFSQTLSKFNEYSYYLKSEHNINYKNGKKVASVWQSECVNKRYWSIYNRWRRVFYIDDIDKGEVSEKRIQLYKMEHSPYKTNLPYCIGFLNLQD